MPIPNLFGPEIDTPIPAQDTPDFGTLQNAIYAQEGGTRAKTPYGWRPGNPTIFAKDPWQAKAQYDEVVRQHLQSRWQEYQNVQKTGKWPTNVPEGSDFVTFLARYGYNANAKEWDGWDAGVRRQLLGTQTSRGGVPNLFGEDSQNVTVAPGKPVQATQVGQPTPTTPPPPTGLNARQKAEAQARAAQYQTEDRRGMSFIQRALADLRQPIGQMTPEQEQLSREAEIPTLKDKSWGDFLLMGLDTIANRMAGASAPQAFPAQYASRLPGTLGTIAKAVASAPPIDVSARLLERAYEMPGAVEDLVTAGKGFEQFNREVGRTGFIWDSPYSPINVGLRMAIGSFFVPGAHTPEGFVPVSWAKKAAGPMIPPGVALTPRAVSLAGAKAAQAETAKVLQKSVAGIEKAPSVLEQLQTQFKPIAEQLPKEEQKVLPAWAGPRGGPAIPMPGRVPLRMGLQEERVGLPTDMGAPGFAEPIPFAPKYPATQFSKMVSDSKELSQVAGPDVANFFTQARMLANKPLEDATQQTPKLFGPSWYGSLAAKDSTSRVSQALVDPQPYVNELVHGTPTIAANEGIKAGAGEAGFIKPGVDMEQAIRQSLSEQFLADKAFVQGWFAKTGGTAKSIWDNLLAGSNNVVERIPNLGPELVKRVKAVFNEWEPATGQEQGTFLKIIKQLGLSNEDLNAVRSARMVGNPATLNPDQKVFYDAATKYFDTTILNKITVLNQEITARVEKAAQSLLTKGQVTQEQFDQILATVPEKYHLRMPEVLENYWPSRVNWKTIGFDNPVENIIQNLQKTQNITEEDAANLAKRILQNREGRPFGNLERVRTRDLPESIRKTAQEELLDYIAGANKRIAEARHWGVHDEIMTGLQQGVEQQTPQYARFVNDWWHFARGDNPYRDQIASKIVGGINDIEGAAKLGLAVISHMLQPANSSMIAGMKNVVKGLISSERNPQAAYEFAQRAGLALETTKRDIMFAEGAERASQGFAQKVLGATGFLRMRDWNVAFTANIGREWVRDLVQNAGSSAARHDLTRIGFSPEEIQGLVTKGLTEADEIRASRYLVDKVMFHFRPGDFPLQWANPYIRLAVLFKRFAYQQGQLITNAVFKEGLNNTAKSWPERIKPLALALTLVPAFGEVTSDAKLFIKKGIAEAAGYVTHPLSGAHPLTTAYQTEGVPGIWGEVTRSKPQIAWNKAGIDNTHFAHSILNRYIDGLSQAGTLGLAGEFIKASEANPASRTESVLSGMTGPFATHAAKSISALWGAGTDISKNISDPTAPQTWSGMRAVGREGLGFVPAGTLAAELPIFKSPKAQQEDLKARAVEAYLSGNQQLGSQLSHQLRLQYGVDVSYQDIVQAGRKRDPEYQRQVVERQKQRQRDIETLKAQERRRTP